MAAYEPPEVCLGETVLWYENGDLSNPPAPAIVTGIGTKDRILRLAIIPPNSYNLIVKDGVRHIGWPSKQQLLDTGSGGWDHTERTKILLQISAAWRKANPPKVAKKADEGEAA